MYNSTTIVYVPTEPLESFQSGFYTGLSRQIGGNTMDLNSIKSHWKEWATTNGDNLYATTRTKTIKKLEIDVLRRWIEKKGPTNNQILEIGCGNGTNCIALSQIFPDNIFYGLDYVDEMIAHAKKRAGDIPNLQFGVDDATELRSPIIQGKAFDIIFTNRCLINLNTIELQKKAIKKVFEQLNPNGYYLMLENSVDSYANQNACREAAELPKRTPADFNLFLDDKIILPYLQNELNATIEAIDNFASLHDLFLYVISPLQNDGKVIYENEYLEGITDFLLKIGDFGYNKFGEFGQNRLYVIKKG